MAEPAIGILMTGDANWLGGIQYIENLARALRALPRGEQPRLVFLYPPTAPRHLIDPLVPLFDSSFAVRSGSALAAAKDVRRFGFGAWRQAPLAQRIRREAVDAVFPVQESLGRNFPVPWLGWIPDFQHVTMPEYFGLIHRLVRDLRFRGLVRDATRLILSSDAALFDLRRFAGKESLRKADVLHFTCVPDDSWFEIAPSEVRAKYELDERFFLVPNQFWAHKNHQDVFEAVRILSDRGRRVQVVCTGSTHDPRRPRHFSQLVAFLETNELQGQVRVLGAIPRTEQMALLRSCLAVIQPSRFEGWSTIVEEAKALGRPLIASNIAVHLEQAHPSALYFSPGNVAELAAALDRIRTGGELGAAGLREELALGAHSSLVRAFGREFMSIVGRAMAGLDSTPE